MNQTYGLGLESYAYREWDEYYNFAALGYDGPTPFSGALQCFCDQFKEFGLRGPKMMEQEVNGQRICY